MLGSRFGGLLLQRTAIAKLLVRQDISMHDLAKLSLQITS